MGRNVKKIKKKIAVLLCAGVLSALICGCAGNAGAPGGKTVVSILYLSDFPHLEEPAETVCPDIDLQCEIMPYTTELTRRLQKGAGPDLVIPPRHLAPRCGNIFWISAPAPLTTARL